MWDRSRLEAIGIFQEPWEAEEPQDALRDDQEIERQRACLQNSWEQREIVYNRGGRGWWS